MEVSEHVDVCGWNVRGAHPTTETLMESRVTSPAVTAVTEDEGLTMK